MWTWAMLVELLMLQPKLSSQVLHSLVSSRDCWSCWWCSSPPSSSSSHGVRLRKLRRRVRSSGMNFAVPEQSRWTGQEPGARSVLTMSGRFSFILVATCVSVRTVLIGSSMVTISVLFAENILVVFLKHIYLRTKINVFLVKFFWLIMYILSCLDLNVYPLQSTELDFDPGWEFL